MIHLYTGDGKGKTTAAIGLTVRATGRGKKVIFAQFMKGNDTGELHALKLLEGVRIFRSSENFGFFAQMTGDQKQAITRIHDEILDELLREAEGGQCDMIILDEVTYPIKWGLLNARKLKRLLAYGTGNNHKNLELVMTGRDPEPFLSEAADYITQMKAVRHPYSRGIPAREGIEY